MIRWHEVIEKTIIALVAVATGVILGHLFWPEVRYNGPPVAGFTTGNAKCSPICGTPH